MTRFISMRMAACFGKKHLLRKNLRRRVVALNP
jgi:hypothetical protein